MMRNSLNTLWYKAWSAFEDEQPIPGCGGTVKIGLLRGKSDGPKLEFLEADAAIGRAASKLNRIPALP